MEGARVVVRVARGDRCNICTYCAQIAESAASENTQMFIATRRRAGGTRAVRGDSARRRGGQLSTSIRF